MPCVSKNLKKPRVQSLPRSVRAAVSSLYLLIETLTTVRALSEFPSVLRSFVCAWAVASELAVL